MNTEDLEKQTPFVVFDSKPLNGLRGFVAVHLVLYHSLYYSVYSVTIYGAVMLIHNNNNMYIITYHSRSFLIVAKVVKHFRLLDARTFGQIWWFSLFFWVLPSWKIIIIGLRSKNISYLANLKYCPNTYLFGLKLLFCYRSKCPYFFCYLDFAWLLDMERRNSPVALYAVILVKQL